MLPTAALADGADDWPACFCCSLTIQRATTAQAHLTSHCSCWTACIADHRVATGGLCLQHCCGCLGFALCKTMGTTVLPFFAIPSYLHRLFCLIEQLGLSKGPPIVPRSFGDGRDDKIQVRDDVGDLLIHPAQARHSQEQS